MARLPDSPAAPRVSAPDIPSVLHDGRPARGADLIAARLTLVGDVDLAHSVIEQCTVAAEAGVVDLVGATLLDVEMTAPKAASLSMRDAGVRRVRISGGRIGTLDLSGARIDELELRDVRIDYLSLAGAKGADIRIADSFIRTLDLPQATLTRVRFDSCRSDEVDPRGLRATDVDLRGLDALAYTDANSLRGVTLSTFQVQQLAGVLAAGVGIHVTD
ncbi:pentapeptide repeat-containing protein [Microbacterium sp. NPDC055903]